MEIIIPRASYGYSVAANLQTHSGVAIDLSGYTVGVRVWAQGTPDTIIRSGSCTVTSATGGLITWAIGSGNFLSGDSRYRARFEATMSGVRQVFEGFSVKIEEGPAT